MIAFTIPGAPQGKARARTCRNGHTYTPDNTVLYENLVKTEFLRQCGRGQRIRSDDTRRAISMQITAVYPVPASYPKRDKAAALAGDLLPTKKPDADNVAKVIADALNGLAYDDDAQITDLSVLKRYGEEPEVRVKLWPVSDEGRDRA
jgi:hypothetical protein